MIRDNQGRIRVIIGFKDVPEIMIRPSFTSKTILISSYGGDVVINHEYVNAVTAYIPERFIGELEKQYEVKYVEIDESVQIMK